MDNGYWTTCLFLGVMYAGRVVLPLNAIAGSDQLGYTLEHSIGIAKKFISDALKSAPQIGHGPGPINHKTGGEYVEYA